MRCLPTIIELERGSRSEMAHILANQMSHLGQVVSHAGMLGGDLEG